MAALVMLLAVLLVAATEVGMTVLVPLPAVVTEVGRSQLLLRAVGKSRFGYVALAGLPHFACLELNGKQFRDRLPRLA